MKMQVRFMTIGYADMEITLRVKGFLAAALYWADENGPLNGWSSFAVIPIDPSGSACCQYVGHRAVPAEATHILAKCISQDFSAVEEIQTEIPDLYRTEQIPGEAVAACSIMSDLHLAGKPGMIDRALSLASFPVLLPGDLTNDGYAAQFQDFRKSMEAYAPDRLVLAVTGNHDQLLNPDGDRVPCFEFQKFLFQRAGQLGYPAEEDTAGAYRVQIGAVDIIGLQCFKSGRKTAFSDGAQIEWLRQYLDESEISQPDRWRIIMCHAPLLAHNPHRADGAPYFAKDAELQKIIDTHRNIIFLSGHTHFSPNTRQGNVEYCTASQTLYIDAGSVTPTELGGEPLMPAEWKDGVIAELILYQNLLEIRYRSIHTGLWYPRGYYRFHTERGIL